MVRSVSVPRLLAWEDYLLGLSVLILLGCFGYIAGNPDHLLAVPEVILPLVVSLGLGVYTVQLKRQSTTSASGRLLVRYAWTGALLSGAIGGAELGIHLYAGLPVAEPSDRILTLVSAGIVTGVLAGRASTHLRGVREKMARDRVLVERSWIDRSGEDPIGETIAEALAEAEGVDPIELDPLYDHVDPDSLTTLQSHDGSPWQFTVYTDDYEIRVSSHGTVTVCRLGPGERDSVSIALQ